MKIQVRPGNWTISIDAFQRTTSEKFDLQRERRRSLRTNWSGSRPTLHSESRRLKTSKRSMFRRPPFRRLAGLQVYQWENQQTVSPGREDARFGGFEAEGNRYRKILLARRRWHGNHLSRSIARGHAAILAVGCDGGISTGDGSPQRRTSVDYGEPNHRSIRIETRNRVSNVEALGRLDRSNLIPAAGWMVDVNSLRLTMSLPPGWRMFAVLGADSVDGDIVNRLEFVGSFCCFGFLLGSLSSLWNSRRLARIIRIRACLSRAGRSPVDLVIPAATCRVASSGKRRQGKTLDRSMAIFSDGHHPPQFDSIHFTRNPIGSLSSIG